LLRKKPGYPLQFLSPPLAGLRDFRYYPLRGPGGFQDFEQALRRNFNRQVEEVKKV
jgi:hypothetical protein